MKESYFTGPFCTGRGRDGCENTLQCNSAACSPLQGELEVVGKVKDKVEIKKRWPRAVRI